MGTRMMRVCQCTDGGGQDGGDGGGVSPPGVGCVWVWIFQEPGFDLGQLLWRTDGCLYWGSV